MLVGFSDLMNTYECAPRLSAIDRPVPRTRGAWQRPVDLRHVYTAWIRRRSMSQHKIDEQWDSADHACTRTIAQHQSTCGAVRCRAAPCVVLRCRISVNAALDARLYSEPSHPIVNEREKADWLEDVVPMANHKDISYYIHLTGGATIASFSQYS